MQDRQNQSDLDDGSETTDSDALNESGTRSSSGGSEDILGPEGDELRERTRHGENVGTKIDTDNEGRVTQRSNSDV